jgi:hypothetical protein
MKCSTLTMTVLLFSITLIAGPLMAQPIYKIVDEHGNVTYTDQKPSDDAAPMDLPELTPVESQVEEALIAPEEGEAVDRMVFRISAPTPNADVLSDDGSLTVELDSNIPIPATAQIVLYIDGIAQEPTMGQRIVVEGIDEGEHSLRAELQTASGRMLAISEEIYVRVHHLDERD